ncbi:hypothetical protein CERZMDRAFT_85522 [Cercospora zeae-maydis SCOH1-5]|uniref:Ketoreductase (KR) domain-containing protein n=1 Tax=Cercospora zeae-maydis SCOH1-5 TaxID=717836 RepID=A0A6A6FD94_9PEZI|nr:hypothetical protein CERZMDRAFT_85522 [Cercospora zeae-maydis SCOH1-5]
MTRNVLNTGGNRGLGLGLVEAYLNKPDTHVFATVRNPSDPTSEPLTSLSKGENSSSTILQLEAGNGEDYSTLAKFLNQDHNINELHLVIANAGVVNVVNTVVQSSVSQFLAHFQINAMGPPPSLPIPSPHASRRSQIHYENEDLVVFPMDPAWVKTDMGLAGADAFGSEGEKIDELLITTQESVDGTRTEAN